MKIIHGMNPVEFDLYASSKYRIKANDAKNRKLVFELTFADFRRMLARKFCHYTGKEMTLPLQGSGDGNGEKIRPTDLTIERIDNRIGYVPGNCIAVCSGANSVKAVFENPSSPLSVQDAIRMFTTIDKMMNGDKK